MTVIELDNKNTDYFPMTMAWLRGRVACDSYNFERHDCKERRRPHTEKSESEGTKHKYFFAFNFEKYHKKSKTDPDLVLPCSSATGVTLSY